MRWCVDLWIWIKKMDILSKDLSRFHLFLVIFRLKYWNMSKLQRVMLLVVFKRAKGPHILIRSSQSWFGKVVCVSTHGQQLHHRQSLGLECRQRTYTDAAGRCAPNRGSFWHSSALRALADLQKLLEDVTPPRRPRLSNGFRAKNWKKTSAQTCNWAPELNSTQVKPSKEEEEKKSTSSFICGLNTSPENPD